MIGLPRGLSVYAYSEPTDMRKSFGTLGALVAVEMKREVLSGELFLFVSRDRKRAKILYFDGTGMCLFAKRLERGQFAAPWKQRRHEMTLSELALFVEGIESLGQRPLSPPLLRQSDLTPKFPADGGC
jgi:transposase